MNVCVVVFAIIVAVFSSTKFFFVSKQIDVFVSQMFILNFSWKIFSNTSMKKIQLFNDVIIYNSDKKVVDSFQQIVKNYSIFWTNIDFAKLSEIDWMKISLKNDWKSRVSNKIKIYSLSLRNRQLINQIFDELHDDDILFWINVFIFFNYSIFCIWKILSFDERKNRIVINIRDLNVIIQFDVYFVLLQSNIILIVRNCAYITIINCVFFYQWRMHFSDRHKLTIINHKNKNLST